MKNLFFLALLFSFQQLVFAQTAGDNTPGYKKNTALPTFRVMKVAGAEVINTADIPKGKPTMFVLFMPDCEHCEKLADTIIMNMNRLKDIGIYMLTPATLTDIKDFTAKKGLAKYENIVLARDYDIFFPKFFDAYDVPFIAIYDKNKQFVTSFGQNAQFKQVLKALQKL